MPDPQVMPAATSKPAGAGDSIISTATTDQTILGEAADQQQQAQAAEEKRLMDADVTTLSPEDKAKREGIETAKEEKRLLETPEDKLSDADKTKKADLVKAKKAAEEAGKVPEKYEFKMPEGVTIDQKLADRFTPIFKDGKLSQSTAQKIVDEYIKIQQETQTQQADEFQKFLKESKDETIKALGPEFKQVLAYAARVRDKFLSKESQELLDASGLANAKAIVMDLIKIGKEISEDKLEVGKPAGQIADSSAKKMYPNMQ